MNRQTSTPTRFPWRTAILSALALGIVIVGVYAFLKGGDKIQEALDKGLEYLDKAEEIAGKAGKKAVEFGEKFKTGTITTHFTESVTQITPSGGDILEVGVIQTEESFKEKDSRRVAWDWVYLGETVAEIRVPVTFRYHIRLSDPWRLVTQGNACIVLAPSIRASLPPAIHTDKMEKSSERGWARLNEEELLNDLEKSITPALDLRAVDKRHIALIREASRQSIAEFVRTWLLNEDHWKEGLFTSIQVVFPDEVNYISDEDLQSMEHNPTLSISHFGDNNTLNLTEQTKGF